MTIEQVKNGICLYLDNEILCKIDGWQKWILGAGCSMAINNFDTTTLKNNKIATMIGFMNENGDINVEEAYKYLHKEAEKGSVSIDVPMLGSINLTERDVTKLYDYIMKN